MLRDNGYEIELQEYAALENAFKTAGVVSSREGLVGVKRIFDSRMRSESWIYGYRVDVGIPGVGRQSRLVKEKNIISLGGDLRKRARDQFRTLQDLDRIGVPVPKLYGVSGAAIYTEFILNDETIAAFGKIEANQHFDEDNRELDQLIQIGVRLDKNGYNGLGFVCDTMYDGDRQQFVLIDAGVDLALRVDQETRCSLENLMRKFPTHIPYILDRYAKFHNSLS